MVLKALFRKTIFLNYNNKLKFKRKTIELWKKRLKLPLP